MHPIQRVGILFSGGPAPAANAVIAAAAVSFLEHGREVIGFYHGFSNLEQYHPASFPLEEGVHYKLLKDAEVRNIRNERGVCIGTSRTSPGSPIKRPEDLDDPAKTARLRTVYEALVALKVDALVTIGGDGTLKTANFLHELQKRLPEDAHRVRLIHLPKTIDNDYRGIDFTFGFFTAVDVMAKELENLRADARSTSSWFIVETMGRKAGWLAYGVAIAGEADLVLGVEDAGDYLVVDEAGEQKLNLDAFADRIIDTMLMRERHAEHYGAVVLAEGLAELLPRSAGGGSTQDAASLVKAGLGRILAAYIARRYKERTGRAKKVTGVQLGYESRSAAPHAFDVMLGSQLGIGAYRGLVEEGLDGHMVSTRGQLDLCYVHFSELINPHTLKTEVRFISPGSDFHRLARFLERRTSSGGGINPGPRHERPWLP